jgi:spore germination protein KC
LGEELAKEGVEDVLDFFARDGETRRTAKLAIVKDGKASDFLQTESEMERLSSQAYAGILENSSIGLSTVVDVDLHHFLLALASEGIEPVAVRVEVIDRLPDVDIRGQMEQRFVSSAPRITGAAVFRGPKLVGWLDKQETRGYNWVMGKVESGIIVIEKPGHEGKYVGLELIRAKSEIKPEMTDGKPEITVKVVAEANIGDIQEMLDVTDTKAMVAAAERRMATVIANEIGLVLHKTQLELASDILGFGRAIYRKYPKEWRNLRETWNDQGFKDLKVKIEVQTRIRHIGLDEIGLPAGR